MARHYSRKKGQSGSTKPSKKSQPTWVRYKPKEVEQLVQKMAKDGKTSAEIGITLRDAYGVPSVKDLANKSITQIMREHKQGPVIPEDLLALIKRSVLIKRHMERNKKDMPSKRGKQLTEAKINRLVKYYKSTGRLAADWKYDERTVRMYT